MTKLQWFVLIAGLGFFLYPVIIYVVAQDKPLSRPPRTPDVNAVMTTITDELKQKTIDNAVLRSLNDQLTKENDELYARLEKCESKSKESR